MRGGGGEGWSRVVAAFHPIPRPPRIPAREDRSRIPRLAWSNLAAQSAEQIGLAATPLVAVLVLGAGAGETGFLQTAQTLPFLILAIPAGGGESGGRRPPTLDHPSPSATPHPALSLRGEGERSDRGEEARRGALGAGDLVEGGVEVDAAAADSAQAGKAAPSSTTPGSRMRWQTKSSDVKSGRRAQYSSKKSKPIGRAAGRPATPRPPARYGDWVKYSGQRPYVLSVQPCADHDVVALDVAAPRSRSGPRWCSGSTASSRPPTPRRSPARA